MCFIHISISIPGTATTPVVSALETITTDAGASCAAFKLLYRSPHQNTVEPRRPTLQPILSITVILKTVEPLPVTGYRLPVALAFARGQGRYIP